MLARTISLHSYPAIPVIALWSLLTTVSAWAQLQYQVTDLGSFLPVSVIDGPYVLGHIGNDPMLLEVSTWTFSPRQHYGYGAGVLSMNGAGEAVGGVWHADGSTDGAFWDRSGGLFVLSSTGSAEGHYVNRRRTIAGLSAFTERGGRATRWYPGAVEEYLVGETPILGGVDGADRVWGDDGPIENHQIVIWNVDGSRTFLGGVGAHLAAVNEIGLGVGSVNYEQTAMKVSEATGIVSLPPLPMPYTACRAVGVNARGDAVGGCHATDSRTLPYWQAVLWPAGLNTTQQDFFTYTFHGLETPGTYHLLVGSTVPNSLQDGSIDDGDVLALAWAPLHVSPGTSTLYATMRAIQARYAPK